MISINISSEDAWEAVHALRKSASEFDIPEWELVADGIEEQLHDLGMEPNENK